jgi:hypothetical protein
MIEWRVFVSQKNFGQAWDKVRRNHGCAGVDGETIASFERHADRNLATLRRQLQNGTYQPMPLRSLSIPKKSKPTANSYGKEQLCCATTYRFTKPQGFGRRLKRWEPSECFCLPTPQTSPRLSCVGQS